MEPQMLVRKAIQKTNIFFHKTLKNLKSFLFRVYPKLPKASPLTGLTPLYCSKSNQNMKQLDQKTSLSVKEMMNEENATSGSFMKFEDQNALKNKNEEIEKEEEKIGNSGEGKGREPSSRIANGGGYKLAQKLKELEMMDMNDADQELDIEEVLNYYSHLKSPVYLDIIDRFFVDMNSEFFLPQPSVTVSNSSRRLGPLKF